MKRKTLKAGIIVFMLIFTGTMAFLLGACAQKGERIESGDASTDISSDGASVKEENSISDANDDDFLDGTDGETNKELLSPPGSYEELYWQAQALGYKGTLNEFILFLSNESESGEILSAVMDEEGNLTITYTDGNVYKQEHNWKYSYTLRMATCQQEGLEIYTCEDCELAKIELIDKTAHLYESDIVAATCVERGYTIHVCQFCGDVYADQYTNPTEHSFQLETIEATTCTTEGYDVYVCSTCGYSYKDNIVTGKGYHSFQSEICADCGVNIADEAITTYDLSQEEDGSIKSYLLDNDNSGYEVYIFGEGNMKNYVESPFLADDYERSIESVYIGSGILNIGENLFKDCINLQKIEVGSGILFIGEGAFANTAYFNDTYNYKYDVLCVKDYIIKYMNLKANFCIIDEDISCIADGAFDNCKDLEEIYYLGNEDKWNKITVGKNNGYFSKANVYFYSESEPQKEGNFWYYTDGEIVKWPQEQSQEPMKTVVDFSVAFCDEFVCYFTPSVSGKYIFSLEQSGFVLYLNDYFHPIEGYEILLAGEVYTIILANVTDCDRTGKLTIERVVE